MQEEIFISIDNPSIKFTDHLKLKDNHRIFFSGKFGIGKSTFIKKFFENNFVSKKVLTLSPINYQVANNEDVFEYIKYDILFQLIENKYLKLDDSINNKILFYEYLKNQGLGVMYNNSINFLSALPKIGHAFKAIDGITKFLESFEEFKNQTIEKHQIIEFFKNIENEKGIKEFDFISEIISDTVINDDFYLVIDDLDRIDPEHIFRLLNIFSSHFNIEDDHNKFGFEKIIFIGDINNIESIYFHRYGSSADISGYLDKFYSNSIFYFSNEDAIISKIGSFLKVYEKNHYKNSKITAIDIELGLVISDLINSSNYTLRKFFSGINNFNFNTYDNLYITLYGNQKINAENLIVFQIYQLLENLFGFDYSQLNKALKNTKSINRRYRVYQNLVDELIILNPNIKFFDKNDQQFKLDGMEIKITEVNDYYGFGNSNFLVYSEPFKKDKLVENFYTHFYNGYLDYKTLTSK